MVRVTLPKDASAVVRLMLRLESDTQGTYTAELLTAEGRAVSAARELASRRMGQDAVVIFDVRARPLRAGDYQVKLARRTGGQTEGAGRYYFRVLP